MAKRSSLRGGTMQSLLIKIILLAITLCGFGYLFMYNSKILKNRGFKIFSTGVLYNLIGKRVKELNKKIYRSASLNKNLSLIKHTCILRI